MIFSGCKNNDVSNINPILKGFTCDFEISKAEVTGKITVTNDETITIEFYEPNNLFGTIISVMENTVTISTLGITKTYSTEDLPDDSLIILFKNALYDAQVLSPKLSSDEIVIEGSTDGKNYKLTLNDIGQIIKAEFEDFDKILLLKNIKPCA